MDDRILFRKGDGCLARWKGATHLVNVSRHVSQCHPFYKPEPKKKVQVRAKKRCGLCSAQTTRMDLHLQRIHGFVRGSQGHTDGLSQATTVIEKEELEQAEQKLAECMEDFK